jgi:hypothetical protein
MNALKRLLMKTALWDLTKYAITSSFSTPVMSGHPVMSAEPVTDATEALDDTGAESAGRPTSPFNTINSAAPALPSMAMGAGRLMNSSYPGYANETLGGGAGMSAPPAKLAMLMRRVR